MVPNPKNWAKSTNLPKCHNPHVLLHQVESNPTTDLTFHWVFNTSGETSELHSPAVRVEGRRSEVGFKDKDKVSEPTEVCFAPLEFQSDPY